MKKIGDVLLDGKDIDRLSDGEFDTSFLKRYRYERELLKCCEQAVMEMSYEPYRGRTTNARVMGRVMELLRQMHGVDAPRGWYPAMKRLRAAADPMPHHGWRKAKPDSGQKGDEPGKCEVEEPGLRVRPEEIFLHGLSVLHPEHSWCGGMSELLQARPDVGTLLIELARKLGVPGGWDDAVPFVDAALAQLSPWPEALVAIREKIAVLAHLPPLTSADGAASELKPTGQPTTQ